MSSVRNRPNASHDDYAFHQQVRMAAVQVMGLRPEELAAALAYEVEPFSGIPANEAEITFTPVADPDPAIRVYDVSVRRRRAEGSRSERLLKPLLLAGAAALLLATADFAFTSRKLGALKRDVARRAELQRQLDAAIKPAAAMRSEAQKLRNSREAAARAQNDAARERATYAKMLSAIADACGERAVLKSLDGNAASLRVKGSAVSATAAADVLVDLTAKASLFGWRLAPGSISVCTPGQTAGFECELTHD